MTVLSDFIPISILFKLLFGQCSMCTNILQVHFPTSPAAPHLWVYKLVPHMETIFLRVNRQTIVDVIYKQKSALYTMANVSRAVYAMV